MKTSKEVIGYKLKNEKYREGVKRITGINSIYPDEKSVRTSKHPEGKTMMYQKLKALDLLDLWFTPVYKEEPELEVGRWYKDSYCGREGDISYITKINERGVCYGYGIQGNSWVDEREENGRTCLYNDVACKYLKPATDAEVEAALIKESKKRYKEGAIVDTCLHWNTEKPEIESWFTCDVQDEDNECCVWDNDSTCVFKDGQWATIIEQPHEVIFPKHLEGKLTIKYQ